MSDYNLSDDDWSLHRKAERDKQRHYEKIKDSIKENLDNIISQEDIITADKGKIIKVPVKSLELPRIRFDPDDPDKKHLGQGSGGSKSGDIIGKSKQPGQGRGKEAGHEPGIEYYEIGMTIEDLAELIFEDLLLPNLKDKGSDKIKVTDIEYTQITKKGITANLDKKRTLIEALKRQAMEQKRRIDDGNKEKPKLIINQEDYRFKNYEEIVKPQRNAVIFAARDTSGSMGEWEAYICRSFFFWMTRFLRTKYDGTEIVFITCHTEAKEVNEHDFFNMGDSGGTKMASAYELMLELCEKRYNPRQWNIYPVLFTDGYNWGDEECVELVGKLLQISNLIGYGEIHSDQTQYGWIGSSAWGGQPLIDGYASLGTALNNAYNKEQLFKIFKICNKTDVWPALKYFFSITKND